jgi:uncharacterized DUF497 family protein
MEFEWDEAKSEWTLAERGFDFAFASRAFSDELRVDGPTRTHKGEQRFRVIGRVGDLILFVVYTWRLYEKENVCRIISARKAGKKERRRHPAGV